MKYELSSLASQDLVYLHVHVTAHTSMLGRTPEMAFFPLSMSNVCLNDLKRTPLSELIKHTKVL